MNQLKTLHLTVTRAPFEVMVTREKNVEYRKPSHWIMSRLVDPLGMNKPFDVVKITNGYGNDKPYFVAKYLGYTASGINYTNTYSNGLQVKVEKGDIRIHLGEIIETGNLSPASSPVGP